MDLGNGMGQSPIALNQTTPVICDCGNYTFIAGVFLREISAILSPSGKAGVLPVQTLVCNACGKVPDKMIPPFLKEEASNNIKQTLSASQSDSKFEARPSTPSPEIKKGNLTLLTDI